MCPVWPGLAKEGIPLGMFMVNLKVIFCPGRLSLSLPQSVEEVEMLVTPDRAPTHTSGTISH
jgi:hypothetical protein